MARMTGDSDHRRMIATKTPGVYKRGRRYTVAIRINGRQRRLSAPNYETARRIKAEHDSKRREEREAFQPTEETFREYASEWIERHQGVRESTRENYRGDLARYAYPRLGDRRIASITGRDLARFVAWLMDEEAQGRRLADSTIANIVKPVRACLRSARTEHQIREDPGRDLKLPKREQVLEDEEEDEQVRAFTREQLAAVLGLVHPRYGILFETLAATGLRISEALGLRWRDLDLDPLRPQLRVRRQFYRGRETPPKTRRGRRTVPLSARLAAKLRDRQAAAERGGPDDLVFPNMAGRHLSVENLRRRHLRPVLGEAEASWASFHSFRHTFASLKLAGGAPITEVSALLGHSTPRVTLDRYSHWLDRDRAEALDLDAELGQGGNKVATRPTQLGEGRDLDHVAIPAVHAGLGGQAQG